MWLHEQKKSTNSAFNLFLFRTQEATTLLSSSLRNDIASPPSLTHTHTLAIQPLQVTIKLSSSQDPSSSTHLPESAEGMKSTISCASLMDMDTSQ